MSLRIANKLLYFSKLLSPRGSEYTINGLTQFFSNIFLFINSGAGSRLLRPVVMFAQGKVDAVNEALYPSL